MLLDYYVHTTDDEKMSLYLPLLSETLEFFYRHYARDQQGRLSVFPTQSLETYWCMRPNSFENCPVNDAPTISALHVLTRRALDLPHNITSESQRTLFTKLRDILPDVPISTDPQTGVEVVSPYESYPNAQSIHNVETPELYSTHPFRYFTLGIYKSQGLDIKPSIYCLENSTRTTCRYADSNTGWTQGVLNAAPLGRAERASKMVTERANTSPAIGYVFPGFAQHIRTIYQCGSFLQHEHCTSTHAHSTFGRCHGTGSFSSLSLLALLMGCRFKLHAPRTQSYLDVS